MPSDASDSSVKLIPQKLIFRKDIKKNFIIKPLDKANHNNQLFGRLKYAKPYKEETIYQSVCGDFLKLANQNVTIINKQNLITKSSITVARYEKDGRVLKEITSENITNLIGKDNYDLVFSTLCSVISQEFKIRGILALLTAPKKSEACCNCPKVSKVMIDIAIQTDESNCDIMLKPQPRRRVKRQHPMPYVVTEIKEKVNRIVINPSDFPSFSTYEVPVKMENVKSEEELSTSKSVLESQTRLADTDFDLDENSMHSTGGLSNISLQTGMTDVLIKEPYSLLSVVEKQTEPNWGNSTLLTVLDGTVVKLPVKPEDDFHIATPEILKYVSPEDRKKLLFYQLYMDWKHCLRRDENGNLAIHTAVINNDVDLVRRQCLVLRSKDLSVDIPASHNMSALQISIKDGSPKCTSMLLHFGADPLAVDDEYYRNCFHLAAEGDPGHLKALVGHCQQNALRILQESEELWKPELESKPKEYQASHLLHQICSMTDNEGETPLMVASKLGRAENVKTLLDAAPRTVNAVMPTSGDTALYRAVGSACHDSSVRGNKSKISENFKQTIEYLIEHDADASIQNHRGFDVNTLLTDFSIGEMSQLIASKLTYINTATRSCEPMMLIKEEDGTVNTVDPKYKRNQKEKTVKNTKNTRKDPVKNTQRGTVKNTQKGCVKNTQRDPVTNTPKGKVKDVKNEKFFVSNLSSVDGNVDTIEMNEASVSKNTAANANFSNQAKGSTSDCNKPVILENKVIKNVESSNDYINRFKSFIDCRNRNSSDNLQLKRKLSPEDASSIDIPVRDSAVTHPRVQTLRRISMSSAKIDQNAGKCDVTNQIPRAKMIKIVRPANSKILVIEDKSSSTKE